MNEYSAVPSPNSICRIGNDECEREESEECRQEIEEHAEKDISGVRSGISFEKKNKSFMTQI